MWWHHETIHTGNFHREGYLMFHHLAGATTHVANLINYNCHPSRGLSSFTRFAILHENCHPSRGLPSFTRFAILHENCHPSRGLSSFKSSFKRIVILQVILQEDCHSFRGLSSFKRIAILQEDGNNIGLVGT